MGGDEGRPLTDVERGAVKPVDLALINAQGGLRDVRRGREIHHHQGVHAAGEAEGGQDAPFPLPDHRGSDGSQLFESRCAMTHTKYIKKSRISSSPKANHPAQSIKTRKHLIPD